MAGMLPFKCNDDTTANRMYSIKICSMSKRPAFNSPENTRAYVLHAYQEYSLSRCPLDSVEKYGYIMA